MSKFGIGVLGLVAGIAGNGRAQVTQIVSIGSGGAQGFGGPNSSASISRDGDGRWIVFQSKSGDLVPPFQAGRQDIYLRNRYDGTTERVSVGPGGVLADGDSYEPSVTSDGRHVVFVSAATNLVPGDTNGYWDAFVRDRQSGTTERVSLGIGGVQGNDHCVHAEISEDGRYIAFSTHAYNVVPFDTFPADVFVRDRQAGTTEVVSADSGGVPRGGTEGSISADGRYVAFVSNYPLVPMDSNNDYDVLVRDRWNGTLELASVDSGGVLGNSMSYDPSLSADGRFVAFTSGATNLVANDNNDVEDVFLRDLDNHTTVRASVTDSGGEANERSGDPSVSRWGFNVAFFSYATNLTPADTTPMTDVFVREILNHQTLCESVRPGGDYPYFGGSGNNYSLHPCISNNGSYVSFESYASDLVPTDQNGFQEDIFLRDAGGGSFWWNVCYPGVNGTIACPCSNPPSGTGRGCDNSSGTGGAYLMASGGQFLSSDSLVFHSVDERPTATSILLQGTTEITSGVVYGQGLRCLGGTIKRLYTKSAVGGSITAPDFAAGDASISSRSAALGNPIFAGEYRYYLVFYRDPVLLGGCPSGSRFNATQTVVMPWSP